MDTPNHGSRLAVKYDRDLDSIDGPVYVAWLDGLDVLYSDVDQNGETTVPGNLEGMVYAVVVSSKEVPNDGNMLSGLAIAQFPFGSNESSNV